MLVHAKVTNNCFTMVVVDQNVWLSSPYPCPSIQSIFKNGLQLVYVCAVLNRHNSPEHGMHRTTCSSRTPTNSLKNVCIRRVSVKCVMLLDVNVCLLVHKRYVSPSNVLGISSTKMRFRKIRRNFTMQDQHCPQIFQLMLAIERVSV